MTVWSRHKRKPKPTPTPPPTPPPTTTQTITGLTSAATYQFAIAAKNAAGLLGARSTPILVTTETIRVGDADVDRLDVPPSHCALRT
jgi:hypothetical protein